MVTELIHPPILNVDEDEGSRSDDPALRTRPVGNDHAIIQHIMGVCKLPGDAYYRRIDLKVSFLIETA